MDIFIRTTLNDTLVLLDYSKARFCRPWYVHHTYYLSGVTYRNSRESKFMLGWKLIAEDALTKWVD